MISFLPTDQSWLCVFVVAMLPMFEIHGAIPFGLSGALWGNGVLPLWQVCLLSFLGATILALVVLLILKLVLRIISTNKKFKKQYKRFQAWLDKKFFKYSMKNSNTKTKKWWTLMLFTAVPLPFSGVWTSCLLSIFMDLKFFASFGAIVVGNVITTMVVSLFCTVFASFVDLVLVL